MDAELRYKLVEEAVRSELLFGPSAESEDNYDPLALQAYYTYMHALKKAIPFEADTEGLATIGQMPDEMQVIHINEQVAQCLANSFYYGNSDKKELAKLIEEFSRRVFTSWKMHIYEELGYIVDQSQIDEEKRLEEFRRNNAASKKV
jgi:hypothetical protein